MNSNRTCYYKGCAITTRWVELGLTEGMSARRFSASFIVIPTREDAWQEFRPRHHPLKAHPRTALKERAEQGS